MQFKMTPTNGPRICLIKTNLVTLPPKGQRFHHFLTPPHTVSLHSSVFHKTQLVTVWTFATQPSPIGFEVVGPRNASLVAGSSTRVGPSGTQTVVQRNAVSVRACVFMCLCIHTHTRLYVAVSPYVWTSILPKTNSVTHLPLLFAVYLVTSIFFSFLKCLVNYSTMQILT